MRTPHAHSFETLFDQPPHMLASAPGVARVAGDLWAALPVCTHVLVARRRDPVVHAASANVEGPARMVYVLGEETQWDAWVDRVQGVTLALREAGHEIPGFDVLVRSEVPERAGLGSSTALVVALVRALGDAYALGLGDDDLAALAARADRAFDDHAIPAAAVAATYAHERRLVAVRDGAHETVPLPHDAELALLFDPAHAAAPASIIDAPRAAELLDVFRDGDAVEAGAILDTLPGARSELLARARRHPAVYGAHPIGDGRSILALVRRGEARVVREAA